MYARDHGSSTPPPPPWLEEYILNWWTFVTRLLHHRIRLYLVNDGGGFTAHPVIFVNPALVGCSYHWDAISRFSSSEVEIHLRISRLHGSTWGAPGGGQVWNGDCSGSFSRNEVSDGSELPLMTSLYRGAVSHTWKISHNLYFHILTSSVIYWIRTIFQSNAKKTRNDVYRAATKVLAAWRSRCLCCHYQKFIKHFFFKATLFKTWICFK